jgi:hypothetical protein
MDDRWYQHQKNAEYGHETYLYRAMRKYGVESFVIEYLSEGLDEEEIILIDQLKPEYNMTRGGDGGDTSSSPNYRNALATRNVSGSNNPMYGRRGVDNPNYGKRRTEAQKENSRAGYKGKRVPVRVHGVDYDSVSRAAKELRRSERYVRIHDELNEWTY